MTGWVVSSAVLIAVVVVSHVVVQRKLRKARRGGPGRPR